MQDTVYGTRQHTPDPIELIFIAQMIGSNEVAEKNLANKIDLLDGKLDRMQQEIIDRNDERIQEVTGHILRKLDET